MLILACLDAVDITESLPPCLWMLRDRMKMCRGVKLLPNHPQYHFCGEPFRICLLSRLGGPPGLVEDGHPQNAVLLIHKTLASYLQISNKFQSVLPEK